MMFPDEVIHGPAPRLQAMLRGALVVSLGLCFAGCVMTPQTGQRQVYLPPSPPITGPSQPSSPSIFVPQPLQLQQEAPAASYPTSIAESGANAAVLALFQQAQQAQQAGNLDDADSDFERAMRLSPRNAFIWSALANLHLKMKEAGQAEAEASKSNSLAAGNPYLMRTNWLTIASARQTAGDAQGAVDARTRAAHYAQLLSAQ
ncbi:MAG TPA: hypothetical protein VFQ88_15800 [Nevskiaceae bacterium]|nr:hypothetical protein [Nevskiaceae bacterium]